MSKFGTVAKIAKRAVIKTVGPKAVKAAARGIRKNKSNLKTLGIGVVGGVVSNAIGGQYPSKPKRRKK